MADIHQDLVDSFISITNCSRENAIEYLENTDWKLDQSINLFFESNCQSEKKNLSSKSLEQKKADTVIDQVAHLSKSPTKPIIIPTVIEFQRFMQSFDQYSKTLLENSSKMVHLAMKCAMNKSKVNLPSTEHEHWLVHYNVDRERLQILLENEMCAPLVWIEHFEHLLNGNLCQLFDCDYMFDIGD